MHISFHPNPESIRSVRAKVESSLGRLASVEVSPPTKANMGYVLATLRDQRDRELAEYALEKLGAENDIMRGEEIWAYNGRMIILRVEGEEGDINRLAMPRRAGRK